MPRKNLVAVDLGGQKITGLGTPSANTDAATKQYVDANGGGAGAARRTFSNANVTLNIADRYVAQIGTMTASRTATLPPAATYPVGVPLRIADESGSVTGTNTVLIVRAGSDTIANGYLSALVSLTAGFQFGDFYSDGVSKWVWLDAYAAAAAYADANDATGGGGGGASVDLAEGAGVQFVTASSITTISARNRVASVKRTVSANLVNNSTTLVADPVLTVPMEGFTDYRLDALVGYNAAVVADLALGWIWPSLTTMAWDATDPIVRQWNTESTVLPILGTGTNVGTRVSGLVHAGSAGNLQLRAAQVTANGTNLTILTGSVITLTRL